jgi:RimJ/RimL family protein N-acetyltransferase
MKERLRFEDVEVRDLGIEDLDRYIDYWHNPSNTALDALGIDRNKMYPARKMREMLSLTIANNRKLQSSQLSILAIVCGGSAVGVHELTELHIGDSAVMHAHIWNKGDRGRGIGLICYVKAMEVYFQRFSLNVIRFETPRINSGANRIKEKLGLKPQGSGVFNLPILKQPVEADTYVIRKEILSTLIERVKGNSRDAGDLLLGQGSER